MNSDLVMVSTYDRGLVALSIVIAMLGSYATINLAGRIRSNRGVARIGADGEGTTVSLRIPVSNQNGN